MNTVVQHVWPIYTNPHKAKTLTTTADDKYRRKKRAHALTLVIAKPVFFVGVGFKRRQCHQLEIRLSINTTIHRIAKPKYLLLFLSKILSVPMYSLHKMSLHSTFFAPRSPCFSITFRSLSWSARKDDVIQQSMSCSSKHNERFRSNPRNIMSVTFFFFFYQHRALSAFPTDRTALTPHWFYSLLCVSHDNALTWDTGPIIRLALDTIEGGGPDESGMLTHEEDLQRRRD